MRQFLRPANIIDAAGVAAIDQNVPQHSDVARVRYHPVNYAGWNHHPDGTWLLQLLHHV